MLAALLTLATLAQVDAPAAKSEPPAAATQGPRVEMIERPSAEAVQSSIDRGVAFLVADQNSDGSWGSATRTKGLNIFAPIPGSHHAFRSATTALCVSALIELDSDVPGAAEALERGEAFLIEFLPQVRRATPVALYNVWGHAFAIQALVRMHGRTGDAARRQTIEELIASQVDRLDRYESVDGGWGYYDFNVGTRRPSSDSISFVNAAALVALKEADDLGQPITRPTVDRAIAATLRQRKPDFSYLYGEYLKNAPMRGINNPGGSLGRSQACNIALRMWGRDEVTDAVLSNWLHRLFARNGWLEMGRKRPVPHESWMQVAGYFYYFGHFYGALCIEALPEAERPLFEAHMLRLMIDQQERDGSWWDYPLYAYHQPYGTAFALMTMRRCRSAE